VDLDQDAEKEPQGLKPTRKDDFYRSARSAAPPKGAHVVYQAGFLIG
jgi:hypothetical protein